MADKKQFHPVPKELPSPDELFHSDNRKKIGTVSVGRQKPIPRYKVIKPISVGFIIALVLTVLVMTNLEKLGIRFFYMQSSSMESVIPKGSFLVVYHTEAAKLKEGDIITFVNQDGISVTHEIIEIVPSYSEGVPGFWTKGTENKKRDEDIVTYRDIQGRVIFHIPYIGNLFMNGAVGE